MSGGVTLRPGGDGVSETWKREWAEGTVLGLARGTGHVRRWERVGPCRRGTKEEPN